MQVVSTGVGSVGAVLLFHLDHPPPSSIPSNLAPLATERLSVNFQILRVPEERVPYNKAMQEVMAEKQTSGETREEEFLALFAASQRSLHAYILALVFDPNAAADILQETNIVLWQKFDQFESGTNFFAWAREIARISVLRHRQSTSSRIALVDPDMLESLAVRLADAVPNLVNDRKDALDECLKKLHESDRLLILARYQPGASVSAIAEKLTRSTNSVSQSLSRIRKSLLECTSRHIRSVAGG